MHSIEGVTGGIYFAHNGDYSGEVLISISEEANWKNKRDPAVEYSGPNDFAAGHWIIRIPFEDLKSLVAAWVRSEKIRHLEEAEDDELLTRYMEPNQ